jgi:hypothetical protein
MRTQSKLMSQDKRVLMLLIAALALINVGLAVVAFAGPGAANGVKDGYGVRVSDAAFSWVRENPGHRIN